MIDRININGVTYSATALEAGAQATGITITVDGVTYLLGDVIAPMTEQAASTEVSGNIDKISVNGVVYDIRDVEDVAAEKKRAMEAETEIADILSEELGREREARISADNTTRSMGVLFGGFINRKTTADEVLIGYKSIDQNHEGAFSIPAATTTSAGAMSANDKKKLEASAESFEFFAEAERVGLEISANSGNLSETHIPAATTESAGVMSAEDKITLDKCKIINIENEDLVIEEGFYSGRDNINKASFYMIVQVNPLANREFKIIQYKFIGGRVSTRYAITSSTIEITWTEWESIGGGGGVAELMVEVTYSELVALRDNASLVAGMKYRITDYVTTTVQQDTKSANHPFDVIVEAVGENELSELAQAIQHEGDTYFDGNDLGAWQLWYDLDNNTDKYKWADAENGKGVIYRMIDEKRNDCPYDFKNILFYNGKYISNITSDKYYYTFSYAVNRVLYDGTIDKQVTNWHSNSMGVYYENGKIYLNRNTFFGGCCTDNTFGNNCTRNTFGGDCTDNTFGNNCTDNTFGNNCTDNTFGNNCTHNTFGDRCTHNTFGNNCTDNTFGKGVSNRKVDKDKTSITLNDEYYDDGNHALVPIKHPDLSTQPSILPYKFMGQYVYEQLIPLYDGVLTPSGYGFNKKDLAVPTPLFIDAKIISLSGTYIYDSACIREGSDYGYAYLIDSSNRRDGYMTVTVGYAKIVYTSMPEEGGDYYNGDYYNGNYYYNSSAISKGILLKSQPGITPGHLYDGSIMIEPVAQGKDYYYDIPDDFKDHGYDSLSILIELKNVTDLNHEVPNVIYSIPDIGEEGTILFAFDNYINLGGLVDKAKQYLVIITVEE